MPSPSSVKFELLLLGICILSELVESIVQGGERGLIPENQAVYEQLYALYKTLHDAFGKTGWSGSLDHVMKDLINIRENQRTA